MKKIPVTLDVASVGITEAQKNKKTDGELFVDWLAGAVELSHKQGMTRKEQRMFYKALDKIEKAQDEGVSEVDLEDAEYTFLRESVDRASFPTSSCKVVNLLYDIFGLD